MQLVVEEVRAAAAVAIEETKGKLMTSQIEINDMLSYMEKRESTLSRDKERLSQKLKAASALARSEMDDVMRIHIKSLDTIQQRHERVMTSCKSEGEKHVMKLTKEIQSRRKSHEKEKCALQEDKDRTVEQLRCARNKEMKAVLSQHDIAIKRKAEDLNDVKRRILNDKKAVNLVSLLLLLFLMFIDTI